jgi:nicotinate phosphoribosyltransferase
MNDIKIYAVPEGTVVFPRIPLIRIEGPVLKTQLLETTLLTLVNFASLVATNAARFRQATGADKTLLEFGLRRAQGPDGGLSASKYCYLGGFDGTSNVLAGKLYGIPVKGTHAHAYVSSYECLEDLTIRNLTDRKTGEVRPFADLCLKYLEELGPILRILPSETNRGELAAFISYAIAFPTNFLALVDTYDVLKSGLPNFLAVARALHECSYQAVGLRLDSGDLAYLSLEVRARFVETAKRFNLQYFEHFTIVASNDINEDTLVSLEKQGHAIDSFGIGTHLVTCQKQPALGCVFKLVELTISLFCFLIYLLLF